MTRAFEARTQPIQFSHEHHVAGNGLDCRYCHTSVEIVGVGGDSPDQDLHELPLADLDSSSPYLEPVRSSYANDVSIEWIKVHDLPDFVYFDHSIHVNKGVGCTTCHGRVDQMPLMWTVKTLQMEWCLDCHRAPEKYLGRARRCSRSTTSRQPTSSRSAAGWSRTTR